MFTPMKLAHLILTHANPGQLKRMLDRLQHDDAHFYVHVDLKTDLQSFLPLANQRNVFFISKRVTVSWGGYSIVQATLNGFEQILASGVHYDYINLMSGQDYPIKSTQYIHEYLRLNPGKIFTDALIIEDEWQEAIPRITQYHLVNHNFPGKYRAQQLMNLLLPRRKMPKGIVAVGRSQWFTATPASIAYLVNYIKAEPWVSAFFKFSWAADEIIFQTILYNSPFRKDMSGYNLMYVDWSEQKASPRLLSMADAPALLGSTKLFARKFSMDTQKEIMDYLDARFS